MNSPRPSNISGEAPRFFRANHRGVHQFISRSIVFGSTALHQRIVQVRHPRPMLDSAIQPIGGQA